MAINLNKLDSILEKNNGNLKVMNVTHNKEETIVDEKTIKRIKNTNDTNYVIKKYSDKENGKYTWEVSEKILYDECFYWDIETVKNGEKIKEDDGFGTVEDLGNYDKSKNPLNVSSHNPIKQFCFIIPNNSYFKSTIKKIKKIETLEREDETEYMHIDINDRFVSIVYYNEDSYVCRQVLVDIVKNTIANSRKVQKGIAFNSNKFDTLIFKALIGESTFDLIHDNVDRKITMKFPSSKKSVDFYDIISVSQSFGLMNLKAVGDFVELPKLENDVVMTKDKYIAYNIRDCEILYKFVEKINKDFGFKVSNFSRYARALSIETMFSKLPDEIEFINSSKKVNEYHLYGARTEAFKYRMKNLKYVDFNSLYTYARLLPIAVPKYSKDSKKATYSLTTFKQYQVFNDFLDVFEEFALKKIIENKPFLHTHFIALHDKYSPTSSFLGKFKIKGIKKHYSEKTKRSILNIFPFVMKKENKSCFQLFEDEVYEVGFHEIPFLAFCDFEIVDLNITTRGNDIFSDWLKDIYKKRKEIKEKMKQGDLTESELLYKALLNISFGIFATKDTKEKKIVSKKMKETYDSSSNEDLKGKVFKDGLDNMFELKKKNNELYSSKINKEQKWIQKSVPLYAMNIISNARFVLTTIILNIELGLIRGSYAYCDTDSIMLDKEAYEHLIELGLIGDELGQLKDEFKGKFDDNGKQIEILEGAFLAPKTYALKLSNGKIKKTLKGGREWTNNKIIRQSLDYDYREIRREALNPYSKQKRTLRGNVFVNKIGFSDDLVEAHNETMKDFA